MKRTLVTGSSGHLGEALVRCLQSDAEDVIGLDIKPSPFTRVTGSITDRQCVRQCLRGVQHVYHAATLHKPHVATHSMQEFVDTNITATLILLEESLAAGVESFVFTSTTSVFGESMRPHTDSPAVWVTEQLPPRPKNIYGVTKVAAEDLCYLFHRKHDMKCIVLRTSRFFPEDDDNKQLRQTYSTENAKANEFLFRRVDLADAVQAHLAATRHAARLGFARFIVSATSPFDRSDLVDLRADPAGVVARKYPHFAAIYEQQRWKMFEQIERVYVNSAARKDLAWAPEYDFAHVLRCLAEGKDPRSPLAQAVGRKPYHDLEFTGMPYPVES